MTGTVHASPSRHTFPKERRLLHRSEFLWVQRKGKRYNTGDLIVCACATPEQPTRVGITTSKKVGNAVVRNRIRRLLREAIRLRLLPALPEGFAIVLIAKKNLSVEVPQARIDAAIDDLVELLQSRPPRVRSQPHGHGARRSPRASHS